MSEENPFEQEPVNPEASNAPKTPFAQGDVSLSGMVSSVLKPQDERERERIEREIKKRQEKIEKQKKDSSGNFKKILLGLLIIIVLGGGLAAVWKLSGKLPVKKIYNTVTAKLNIKTKKAGKLEVWDSTQVVFADTFRLKLKSSKGADRATLVLTQGTQTKNISGYIVGQDEKSLTWEFLVNRLAKGQYTYKVFVKDSGRNELKELKNSFELK